MGNPIITMKFIVLACLAISAMAAPEAEADAQLQRHYNGALTPFNTPEVEWARRNHLAIKAQTYAYRPYPAYGYGAYNPYYGLYNGAYNARRFYKREAEADAEAWGTYYNNYYSGYPYANRYYGAYAARPYTYGYNYNTYNYGYQPYGFRY